MFKIRSYFLKKKKNNNVLGYKTEITLEGQTKST